VLDAAPLPAFMMELKGRKADHRYDYFDAQHRLLGFVLRWEGRDVERKQFLPFTYWRNQFGGGAWRRKTWPRGKRPLYGEDKLGAHPHAMVALLEGEKTADAMHCGPLADAFKRCSEGVIAVTWPGGGNALEAVDLSPLADRDVIILPDDDEAGEQTADALVEILRKVGVRRVRRWKAPPDARLIKPSGWDIADALPPGWTAEALVQSILDAPEVRSKAVLRVEDWLMRDLPNPDFILGSWLTTTSRVLLTAPTGLGKTLFGVTMSGAIADGKSFLPWKGRRHCRVLYIDGEMALRLLKQRLIDETRRLGAVPAGLYALSHADIENFQPLNTDAGRNQIEEIIAHIGEIDLIWFDNIMSLISGDMKDEEGWRQTLPWQHTLTKRNIGQIWIHHTGHDESRAYGTKTREWQMDTCIFLESAPCHDTDVSLSSPSTRRESARPPPRQTSRISPSHSSMTPGPTPARGVPPPRKKPSPLAAKFLEALLNCETVTHEGRRCVPTEGWRAECIKHGLIDRQAR
jgi:hypothetical protein